MKLLSLLLLALTVAAQGVKLPGELAAYQRVELRPRVAGIVENMMVDRGSVVKEGDLLATLAAPELQAQLAEVEAKAQAIEAQKAEIEARAAASAATLEKLRVAARTPGAVAANDIEQAARQVEALRALAGATDKSAAATRAQSQALKEMISYLTVKAPFAGVVSERMAHPGALAGPASAPLLVLEQVSRLRLVVAVPESELSAAVRGARLSFTVPALPGRKFQGAIARLARSLDGKTRTMAVEADIANADGALAPGMYAEVELARSGR